MNVKRLNNGDFPYYEVDSITNYNEFLEWLYKLDEQDMSLAFSGNLFRFRNPEERLQFVFGFQAAWNVLDDAYLEKQHGGSL